MVFSSHAPHTDAAVALRPAPTWCYIVAAAWPVLLLAPILGLADTWYYSDYPSHVALAERSLAEGTITTPHFLFHWMTIAIAVVLPGHSFRAAASLLLLLAAAMSGIGIYAVLNAVARPTNRRQVATLLGMVSCLAVIGPIVFATLHRGNIYRGYFFPATVWHNPTILILKPFALAAFATVMRLLDPGEGAQRRPVRLAGTCGILVVLATLAKPSYTMCLIPALPVLVMFDRELRRARRAWLALAVVVVPGVAVIAWQYLFTYASRVEGCNTDTGGIAFDPFALMLAWDDWPWIEAKLLLSTAFPLCVTVAFFQDAWRSVEIKLSWLAFVVACAYCYLLVETGPRKLYGNLAWSCQITLFVLFVYCAGFLAARLRSQAEFDAGRGRALVCLVVFALHVAGGVVYYACQLALGIWGPGWNFY